MPTCTEPKFVSYALQNLEAVRNHFEKNGNEILPATLAIHNNVEVGECISVFSAVKKAEMQGKFIAVQKCRGNVICQLQNNLFNISSSFAQVFAMDICTLE